MRSLSHPFSIRMVVVWTCLITGHPRQQCFTGQRHTYRQAPSRLSLGYPSLRTEKHRGGGFKRRDSIRGLEGGIRQKDFLFLEKTVGSLPFEGLTHYFSASAEGDVGGLVGFSTDLVWPGFELAGAGWRVCSSSGCSCFCHSSETRPSQQAGFNG